MTAGLFPFNQAQADQIDAHDALRLVAALRHKIGDTWEPIWLQTFADAPDSAYVLEEKTSRSGRPYTVKKWCVTDVPKSGGKVGKVQGVAENWGAVTLDQLADTPYSRANLARVGVFFAVNVLQADAPRRKAEHVARVAAVFLDLDGAPMPADFPLQPTATVESSAGRHHVYWAVSDVPLEEFKVIQQTLARRYGADTQVCDLPRVMRLPGYYHGKRTPGELVRLTSLQPDAQYTRADLLEAWPSLAEALATAEAERTQQHVDATRRRAEADQLRQQIAAGAAGSRVEVQQKYGRVGLLGCCADLLGAPEGQRNYTLNATAYRVGRLIGAGVLEEAEAVAELRQVAERVGLEPGEITTTLSSGLAAGKADPVDVGKVGQFVGVRQERTKSPNAGLIEAAEAAVDQHGEGSTELLDTDELPAPAGEGDTYSDQQVKDLLGITWPVLAVDTEKAHAYRLRDVAGDDLGYVAELGGYVAWNGKQWLSGGKNGAGEVEAKRHAQGLGVAMQPELDRLLALFGQVTQAAARASTQYGHDSPQAKDLRLKAAAMERAYYQHARAAKGTESDAKQKAVLSSARTLYVKSVREFEPRPWLVGFQNGVWDHGVFRPAQRADHMLTLAAVAYQPEAPRGDWLAVLDRITGGDADLQRTLQDVAGYALSGASSLRLLPWLYGEAGTGKSTFSELLATVLGDMAATIDPKLFAADAARERLGAAIWGKRVALCAEAGNQRLDAEALKTLSGGDRLSVRMLYAEAFTARASHVLMMVANDAPRVEAYDEALKDRVLALPFRHPLKTGGPLLAGRRLEELRQDTSSDLVAGFTAWAVEGLTRVHQVGDIHRAAVCRTATSAFWAEVDPLADFWQACDPSALAMTGVPVGEFRASYEEWAKSGSVRPMTTQRFNKACRSVGLEQVKRTGGMRVWQMENPALFPALLEADQGGAVGHELGGVARVAEFSPISQKSFSSLTRMREEKDFMENASKSATLATPPASGWDGGEM
ncbi:phage/plasmid primase, P4 family [Deinococcus sp. PEB2-63]